MDRLQEIESSRGCEAPAPSGLAVAPSRQAHDEVAAEISRGPDLRAVLGALSAVVYDWDIASDQLTWGANVGETLAAFSRGFPGHRRSLRRTCRGGLGIVAISGDPQRLRARQRRGRPLSRRLPPRAARPPGLRGRGFRPLVRRRARPSGARARRSQGLAAGRGFGANRGADGLGRPRGAAREPANLQRNRSNRVSPRLARARRPSRF